MAQSDPRHALTDLTQRGNAFSASKTYMGCLYDPKNSNFG